MMSYVFRQERLTYVHGDRVTMTKKFARRRSVNKSGLNQGEESKNPRPYFALVEDQLVSKLHPISRRLILTRKSYSVKEEVSCSRISMVAMRKFCLSFRKKVLRSNLVHLMKLILSLPKNLILSLTAEDLSALVQLSSLSMKMLSAWTKELVRYSSTLMAK